MGYENLYRLKSASDTYYSGSLSPSSISYSSGGYSGTLYRMTMTITVDTRSGRYVQKEKTTTKQKAGILKQVMIIQ